MTDIARQIRRNFEELEALANGLSDRELHARLMAILKRQRLILTLMASKEGHK